MTKKDLPLIELMVNLENDAFVSAIAMVGSPAIESNFIAFNSESVPKIEYSFNSEKRELIGAAMLPNIPIYRNDKQLGEYAVTFSAKTIREISQIFSKKGLLNNLNIEHSTKSADSYVFQSYIVDEAKGIFAPNDLKVPDGSWIIGVKVESDDVWNDIKSGKRQGFSVEGIFDLIDTKTLIDLEFNNLKHSQNVLAFAKELEVELDSIIKKFNL